jgi:hypothetical protein
MIGTSPGAAGWGQGSPKETGDSRRAAPLRRPDTAVTLAQGNPCLTPSTTFLKTTDRFDAIGFAFGFDDMCRHVRLVYTANRENV